jgi:methionyl-tRNA synthetase
MRGKMDAFRAADALEAVMNLARRANKYIDETVPWVLGRDEAQSDRLASVLANLLEAIRFLGVLLAPFLPETSQRIFAQLNCPEAWRTLDSITAFGAAPAPAVAAPEPLFARLDIDKLLKAPAGEPCQSPPEAEKPAEVTYDDFMKTRLTVGLIRSCEKVEKADKLLKLTVFDGTRERIVLSGIAQWYTPGQLTGKKIVLVSNLKPVKMRGIVSEGMLLAADGAGGAAQVVFLPDDMEPGGRIR